ncbi:glycosyltransferase, partial [Candidatus Woesearchaeota archaeon]|nr:glycosyltransferase [Candidatus Woesearchaeota archaeon]
CRKDYEEDNEFLELMDGFIIINPLQEDVVKKYSSIFRLIELPIINTIYKKEYREKDSLDIIWQGLFNNKKYIEKLEPIIERLAKQCNYRIKLVYNTNCVPLKDDGIIRFIPWKMSAWQKILAQSDIGVTIKDFSDKWEKRKPSTKVLSYMAAGLPVICTPTEADKMVIKHGETGYFAYTEKDWYKYLKMLIENPKLREKIGKAGREYAVNNFSVEKIGRKYIDFFDELRKDNPVVSVIMPTYNRPKMLRRAIKSVMDQTYKNFELLVVNDGGEDVKYIIKEFNCNAIKYFYKKNGGLSSALNYGLDRAKGKYIAYLDDDDYWLPHHLKILVNFLDNNHEVGLVYAQTRRIDLDGNIIKRKSCKPYDKYYLENIDNQMTTCSVMHRKNDLRFEDIKTHMDWIMWAKLSKKGVKIAHLDKISSVYVRHKNAMLTKDHKDSKEKARKIIKRL